MAKLLKNIKIYWLPVSAFSLSLVSLFLLVLGFQAWNQSDPCISSGVVKTISIVRKGTTDSSSRISELHFPFCEEVIKSLTKEKTSSELIAGQQSAWITEIQETKKLEAAFSSPHNPIHILIREDQPFYFHASQRLVEVGTHFASAKGQLARVIFKSWILQNHPDQHPLVIDIIADFMLAVSQSDFELEIPSENQILKYDQSTLWPHFLVTYEKYCTWPWRMSEHIDYCLKSQGQKEQLISLKRGSQKREGLEGSSETLHEITHLSLRPAVGALLWNLYLSLPLNKRHIVIENLLKKKVLIPELNMSNTVAVRQSIENLAAAILKPLIEDSDSNKATLLVHALLEKRKVEETSRSKMVIVNGKEQVQALSQLTLGRSVWLKTENSLWLLDKAGLREIELPLEFLRVSTIYGISCGYPKWKVLEEYGANADRYVHINWCGGPIDWSAILKALDSKKNLDPKDGLIEEIGEMNQVQYYLPSLKVALEQGLAPEMRLSTGFSIPNSFTPAEKLLGLDTFPDDYVSQTEWHPRAPVELIESARIAKGKCLLIRTE